MEKIKEGKKGGKWLWSIAASVFMCLTLCACKAEGEMENVSGADIGQAVAAMEAEGISDAQKSEGTGEALGTEEDEIIALRKTDLSS